MGWGGGHGTCGLEGKRCQLVQAAARIRMAEAALGLDAPASVNSDRRPSTAPPTTGGSGSGGSMGLDTRAGAHGATRPSRRAVAALVRAVQSAPPGRSKAMCRWLQVARTRTHTHAHTHPHTRAPARKRARTHAPTHTHAPTRKRARTHATTHTHTRARAHRHARLRARAHCRQQSAHAVGRTPAVALRSASPRARTHTPTRALGAGGGICDACGGSARACRRGDRGGDRADRGNGSLCSSSVDSWCEAFAV